MSDAVLEEYYSDVFRFTASVFPSQQDDVITSPYNSILSLYELMQHADCVLPIDNQALINIVNEADALKAKLGSTGNTKSEQPTMAKVTTRITAEIKSLRQDEQHHCSPSV